MLGYRSFHLDSVRHFQSLEEIEKLVDAAAALGFNKFHWHLTDDQGWRFESKAFPALNAAAVRSRSDFGKTREEAPYGRIYTRAEMRRVVDFCADRGVDVVPEFEMPGHASALLSVFPELSCAGEPVRIKTHQGIFKDVLCPAKEKTFEVVTALLDEFLDVFPGEYIHVGGDETPRASWKACPDCRRYMKEHNLRTFDEYQGDFMNRIVDHLEQKGRHAIVWNEAARGGNLDRRAVLQCWKEGERASVRFINGGGKAILSPFSRCYFDYDYAITPLNRVYETRPTLPGLTKEGQKNVLGLEACLWTEFISDEETLERLAFPRLIAAAAIAKGENGQPYEAFLEEVRRVREERPDLAFADEALWTQPRLRVVPGWLKYLRDHVSIGFLKEQIP